MDEPEIYGDPVLQEADLIYKIYLPTCGPLFLALVFLCGCASPKHNTFCFVFCYFCSNAQGGSPMDTPSASGQADGSKTALIHKEDQRA